MSSSSDTGRSVSNASQSEQRRADEPERACRREGGRAPSRPRRRGGHDDDERPRRPRGGCRRSSSRARARDRAGSARGRRGTGWPPRARSHRDSRDPYEVADTPAGGHRGDLERRFGTGGTIGAAARAGTTGPATPFPRLTADVLSRLPAQVGDGRLGLRRGRVRDRRHRSSRRACSGSSEFGVFATALAAVGFFQVLLDLTVEESLTKYGFRYVAAQDWGRLRRLFRQMLAVQAHRRRACDGILARRSLPSPTRSSARTACGAALLAAALLPLVQSPENVGATALLLHSRYDLRGAYQAGSAALRLIAIAIGAQYGVDGGARRHRRRAGVSTVVISVVGHRRAAAVPAAPRVGLWARTRAASARSSSSRASRPASSRCGRRSSRCSSASSPGPTQVGLFRIAQTPQTGLAAASSPARLVLLTEQTRDWERGSAVSVLDGVRSTRSARRR